MCVVGLVGMTLGGGVECKRRTDRFRALAEYHRSRFDAMLWGAHGYHSGHEGDWVRYWHPDGKEFTFRELDRLLWHRRLESKYLRAASRPWLPVEPDPAADPRRRGCSCGEWETKSRVFRSLGYEFGYCGRCETCGRLCHTRRSPGAWPSTGAWCDFHYRLLLWTDVRSPLGCLVWLEILGVLSFLLGRWLLARSALVERLSHSRIPMWLATHGGDRPSPPDLQASAAYAGSAVIYGGLLTAIGFVLACDGLGVPAFLWVGLSGLILWPIAGTALAYAHRGGGKAVFLSAMSLQYLFTCSIASGDGEWANLGRLSAVGRWLVAAYLVTCIAGQAAAWWEFPSRARRDV
jgi:hypothetical protein